MAEPPATTIDDLPYEMLEKVIPDLKPKTISALKLVNIRFYQLLSNDIYFKSYLRFPEKNYLCEMKNVKNSGKEVIEEINNGTIGKWKGYLTLGNLHLGNLKSGNITGCELVPLAPPRLDESQHNMTRKRCWGHRIDEDGEYWLVSRNLDGYIELVNITNEPKTYVEKEISTTSTYEMHLIPGQVVCTCRQYRSWHIVVLNIVDTGGEISLQRNFDFVIDEGCGWSFATVKCKSTGKRRNVLAYNTIGLPIYGIIHFRDLESGNSLADVCLWNYPCLKKFGPTENESASYEMCYDDLYNNSGEESPYIAISIEFMDEVSLTDRSTVIVVYNVDFMKATSFAHIPTHDGHVSDVHLTRNGAYIFSAKLEPPYEPGCVYSVEVHRLPLEGHGDIDELKVPKLSYSISNLRSSEGFASTDSFIRTSVHGKLLLLLMNEFDNVTVRIIRMDESEVYDVARLTVDGAPQYYNEAFFNVIGHDVLVVEFMGKDCSVKMFKILMKEEGAIAEELVTWNKMLSDFKLSFRQPQLVLSQDISKLVVYDTDFGGNDQLAIFHF